MTKKKIKFLIIYIVVFYSVMIFFEMVGKDYIDKYVSNEILRQIIKTVIIKNSVWTLPAFCFLQVFGTDVYISTKEMFTTKVNWWRYMPVFIVFTLWIITGAFINNHSLSLSCNLSISEIIIVLFVGLTEEMVFRGLILNLTITENHKWIPIIINSIMFLAIHFPSWIHTGTFVSAFTGFDFLCVITLSIVFSWTFIKSRNILVPISLHMYWDLLMFMFYGM